MDTNWALGIDTGRKRSSTAFITLKIAVLAPIPSAASAPQSA
jgi:hypothetical protein